MFIKDRDEDELYVIHTAAIFSIQNKIDDDIYETNVKGTKNICELSLKYKVKRFIHISSVHSIPTLDNYKVMKEINSFNDELVVGGYSKSKALGNNVVLDYIKKGLNAIVL